MAGKKRTLSSQNDAGLLPFILSRIASAVSAGAGALGVFGNGTDGAMVLNGTNTFPGLMSLASPGPAGVYTLLTDVFPTTMVINAGISLLHAGFAIHAQTSIVNAGSWFGNIGVNGQTGVAGGAGGPAAPYGTCGGSFAGGAGAASGANAAGGAGTASTNTYAQAGVAGAGGGDGTHAGGAAGAKSGLNNRSLSQPAVSTGFAPNGATPSVMVQIEGGPGAGGGASTGTGQGGGGGSSAGVAIVAAPTITNTGTMTSPGGAGGNATAAGGGNVAGGGGGGDGGLWLVTTVSGTITGNQPTALAGAPGTGAGAGGLPGVAGSAGIVVISTP